MTSAAQTQPPHLDRANAAEVEVLRLKEQLREMQEGLLDDAQALQAAAEHVEARYPGMAVLMRRCATRLYRLKERP